MDRSCELQFKFQQRDVPRDRKPKCFIKAEQTKIIPIRIYEKCHIMNTNDCCCPFFSFVVPFSLLIQEQTLDQWYRPIYQATVNAMKEEISIPHLHKQKQLRVCFTASSIQRWIESENTCPVHNSYYLFNIHWQDMTSLNFDLSKYQPKAAVE